MPLFPKDRLPEELWIEARRLASGTEEQKLGAIDILSSGKYRLPEQAKEVFLDLASLGQPKIVRVKLASLIGQSTLPVGIHYPVAEVLETDPDEEVQSHLQEFRAKMGELEESLGIPIMREWLKSVIPPPEIIAQLSQMGRLAGAFVRENHALLEQIRLVKQTTEVLKSIGAFNREFVSFAQEYARETTTEEFKEFEAELGWLEILPMPNFWHLYLLSKSGGVEAAWQKLVSDMQNSEFREGLLDTLVDCRLFEDRIGNVRLGVGHFARGDYVSAISVLLPQIEGLVWDIGVAIGLVDPAPNSKVKLDKKGNLRKSKRGKPMEWGLGELVARLWGNRPFEDYFRRQVYSTEFRHPVLHGRRNDLFHETNATGAILYFLAIRDKAMELGLC